MIGFGDRIYDGACGSAGFLCESYDYLRRGKLTTKEHIADVDRETFDLSVKNPNKTEKSLLREPQEILDEIAALDAESAEILAGIGGML